MKENVHFSQFIFIYKSLNFFLPKKISPNFLNQKKKIKTARILSIFVFVSLFQANSQNCH